MTDDHRLADLVNKISDLVREAYTRGAKDNEASVASRLFEVFGSDFSFVKLPDTAPKSGTPSPKNFNVSPGKSITRARRGSVEPQVIEALRGVKGKRVAEIAAETGIPENSVRGTLNRLRNIRVFKTTSPDGEVWRLLGPQANQDGSTTEITQSGHIVDKPAHLVRSGSPEAQTRRIIMRENLIGGLEDYKENEAPSKKEGAS